MCPIRWSCACRTARNWTIPLNRASPDWGPLSDMRQHGCTASDPDGDTGWRAGVLDAWLWTRDRATLAKNGTGRWGWESMRWLEGFERCAPNWPRVCPTPAGSTSPTGCDIHEFMVRARRQPQIDWLIRATHNRCLAGVTIGGTDWRWRWSWARWLILRPGRRAGPVGGADGADRTGHAAPERRRTRDGDRAASPGRIPAGRGRAARLAFVEQPAGRHPSTKRLNGSSGAERAGVSKFFPNLQNRLPGGSLATEHPGATGTGPGRVPIIAWRIPVPDPAGADPPQLPCDAVLDPAEWQAVYVAIRRRPRR